jgi:heterodisulfide reductase subunit B
MLCHVCTVVQRTMERRMWETRKIWREVVVEYLKSYSIVYMDYENSWQSSLKIARLHDQNWTQETLNMKQSDVRIEHLTLLATACFDF